MTTARLVFVKGLSSSTTHRSHTGQGTEWRREPTRHIGDETDDLVSFLRSIR